MSQYGSSSSSSTAPAGRSGGAAGPQGANIPLILVAVALGLVAVITTNWYIQRVKASIEADSVTVYRLNTTKEPGDRLRRDDVEATDVRAGMQLPNAVIGSDIDQLTDDRLTRTVNQNGYLLWEHFAPQSTGGMREPAEGYRGFAIPVDSDTAPPMLRPDQMVDISANLALQGERPRNYLVMERVKVLAVGSQTTTGEERRGSRYRNITIQVRPEEARLLETIRQFTEDEEFTIAIRNAIDDDLEQLEGGIHDAVLNALGLEQP